MKYCPQCNRQYAEAWLTFCTNDGSLLREDLSPPADPNWDPQIREPGYFDPGEQETQWFPGNQPGAGGWMAPDERAPVTHQWQPPPPPPQPNVKPAPPGVAIASFIIGVIGLVTGLFCGIPVPGIVAVILGFVALSQMRNSPNSAGRGLAIAGLIMGGINLAFFVFGLLWLILSVALG